MIKYKMYKVLKSLHLISKKKFQKKQQKYLKINEKKIATSYKNIKDNIISLDKIKKIISSENIDIISFDIFDTLLVRPVINPTDIFYLIDAKLKQENSIDFIKYRQSAEAELNNPFASLDDIYSHIQDKYHFDKKTINLMKQEELNCEHNLLTARDDMFEIYQYARSLGKRVIATSDMYLSSDFLKKTLKDKGYKDIETVYVSNELKARKDNGKLYQQIKQKEQSEKIFHIGDNYESDYLKALEENITAVYYPSIKNILLNNKVIYNDIWQKGISNDPFLRILLGFTLNNYFKNLSKVKNQPAVFADFKSFTQLSLAPLIFYISINIANNATIQKKYKQVLFASRDGFLPKMGYDILKKYMDILPSKYIFAGRRAYFPATVTLFSDFVNKLSIHAGDKFTIEKILDIYILDKDLNKRLLSQLTQSEKELDLSRDHELFVQTFKRFDNDIDVYIKQCQQEIQKYYVSHLSNSEHEVIFDCGYSGSISKNLTSITGKAFDKIYLWETNKNQELDKVQSTQTYILMQEPIVFKAIKQLYTAINLLYEELFSPCENGCIGFKNKQALIEKGQFSSQMQEEYKIRDKEISDYMETICKMLSAYLPYINIEDTQNLQQSLVFALKYSPYNEIELFKNIKFPDPVYFADTLCLDYKVIQNHIFQNVYQNTGFNNPLNEIQASNKIQGNNLKIGLHYHLFNFWLYQELLQYVQDFPQKFDLIITVCDKNKESIIKNIFNTKTIKNLDNLIIKVVENRGRDIAPWLVDLNQIQRKYDLFCHIHGKHSPHFSWGNDWRKYLFDNLIKKESVIDIINLFVSNDKLGCLFPSTYNALKNLCIEKDISKEGINGEINTINTLLEKMGYEKLKRYDLFFSEGTMMWYRPKAMQPLFDLNLKASDFPPEPIGVGGTIAHAIERLPALVCKNNGYLAKSYTKYLS